MSEDADEDEAIAAFVEPMRAMGRGELIEHWRTDATDRPCLVIMMKIVSPDLLRAGVTRAEPAYYTGYARTRLSGDDLHADNEGAGVLEIHGGLNYGPDDEGWVGFDCGHAFDLCVDRDGEPLPGNIEASYRRDFGAGGLPVRRWAPADVREEVTWLAAQLDALEAEQADPGPDEKEWTQP